MVFLSFISPPTQVQSSSDRDVVQSACPYLALPNKRLPSGARAGATGLGICRWHAPEGSPRVLHQQLRAPDGARKLPLRWAVPTKTGARRWWCAETALVGILAAPRG